MNGGAVEAIFTLSLPSKREEIDGPSSLLRRFAPRSDAHSMRENVSQGRRLEQREHRRKAASSPIALKGGSYGGARSSICRRFDNGGRNLGRFDSCAGAERKPGEPAEPGGAIAARQSGFSACKSNVPICKSARQSKADKRPDGRGAAAS